MKGKRGKFFWGAATSAHQVEGGNKNDWTEWEKENAARLTENAKNNPPAGGWQDYLLKNYPNPLRTENYISGRACDHYDRFREDFDIAKRLGHNAHRFSIEWSRIEPEEGKFDEREIEHYREVIRALRERGIEPFVTLWHWTLPLWLAKKNGVECRNFPIYFERYAETIVAAIKNDVRFWITINEPEIYSSLSYFRGVQPPQKKSIVRFYRSVAHLVKAHRLAYRVIHKIASEATVGAALNMSYFESAGGFINNMLVAVAKAAWNLHFLNHVRASLDFIGLNYYAHNRVNYGFNKNRNLRTSDMGWEVYPEGIYHVLKDLERYNLPIYVTENGLADARDAKRADFIREHVDWIKKARTEGVDVRGYLYWSLLDNFEMPRGDGFWPRFGLVEVNYKTMEREIRPSALVYKKIIENSKL